MLGAAVEVGDVDETVAGLSHELDEGGGSVGAGAAADAGFDENYLARHWQSNEPAFEFVEWFGNKYGLHPQT